MCYVHGMEHKEGSMLQRRRRKKERKDKGAISHSQQEGSTVLVKGTVVVISICEYFSVIKSVVYVKSLGFSYSRHKVTSQDKRQVRGEEL